MNSIEILDLIDKAHEILPGEKAVVFEMRKMIDKIIAGQAADTIKVELGISGIKLELTLKMIEDS